MILVVCFENKPGETAEHPRPVAKGDVGREPNRPFPAMITASGFVGFKAIDVLCRITQLPMEFIFGGNIFINVVVNHIFDT